MIMTESTIAGILQRIDGRAGDELSYFKCLGSLRLTLDTKRKRLSARPRRRALIFWKPQEHLGAYSDSSFYCSTWQHPDRTKAILIKISIKLFKH